MELAEFKFNEDLGRTITRLERYCGIKGHIATNSENCQRTFFYQQAQEVDFDVEESELIQWI